MSPSDGGLDFISKNDRKSWVSPAIVFAGVEFNIAVIMAGAGLVQSYGIYELAGIAVIGLVITWIGDSLMGYVGAKTGLSSTVIARSSFGTTQARTLISSLVLIANLGWWGINTAVMADAVSQVFGITQSQSWFLWSIIVIIIGLIFATPAIAGYESMQWVDYAAVPAGLLILLLGVYLAVQQYGVSSILDSIGSQTMALPVAISTILGLNTIQWVIASDYSRQHEPTLRDSILMPSLLVVVGFILIMVGGVMAIGEGGSFDLVNIMAALAFPIWAYLLLFIAQWTSQLVSVYSSGLAGANIIGAETVKKRRLVTFIVTMIGIALALAGILSRFQDFLLIIGFTIPPAGAIIVTDFLILNDREWEQVDGWNWLATFSFGSGFIVGYYTQFVNVIGLPAVQSYLIAALIYYTTMSLKAQISPGKFTSNFSMDEATGD